MLKFIAMAALAALSCSESIAHNLGYNIIDGDSNGINFDIASGRENAHRPQNKPVNWVSGGPNLQPANGVSGGPNLQPANWVSGGPNLKPSNPNQLYGTYGD